MHIVGHYSRAKERMDMLSTTGKPKKACVYPGVPPRWELHVVWRTAADIDRELENGELAVKHHQREVARGLADRSPTAPYAMSPLRSQLRTQSGDRNPRHYEINIEASVTVVGNQNVVAHRLQDFLDQTAEEIFTHKPVQSLQNSRCLSVLPPRRLEKCHPSAFRLDIGEKD
ncbi:hypothetical protein BDV96DRAFT_158117 [Lophiotrema nucula]|uniref:Uncharacterized protein n=1 Tax=Lophiotrema nucula TaxID=690887 RepID=A0A6A5Z1S4_9PLEO|nr:hypothetical protein BDV96DRAFT_158117 [Lophiotrema nucula]